MRKRISTNERRKLLVNVASSISKGESISSIARTLHLSRPTVQALSNQAVQQGLLVIRSPLFRPPEAMHLENEIKSRYKMKEVVIIPDKLDNHNSREILGKFGAEYLEDLLIERKHLHTSIGVSGGITLSCVVDKFNPAVYDVSVIPLNVFERIPSNEYASAGYLAMNLAAKCKSSKFSIGLFADDQLNSVPVWKLELSKIQELNSFKQIKRSWENLDIAVMGVAPLEHSSSIIEMLNRIGWQSPNTKYELILNMSLVNHHGAAPEDYFLSIKVETLRRLSSIRTKDVILIAGGNSYHAKVDKSIAIKSVLEMSICNTLITDISTSRAILA